MMTNRLTPPTDPQQPVGPQNPADNMLHVLRVWQGLSEAELDMKTFRAWRAMCAAEGLRHELRPAYPTIPDAVQEIAEAGHAAVWILNNTGLITILASPQSRRLN